MNEQNQAAQPWEQRVGVFAQEVSKSIEEVSAALEPVCGEPGDKALEVLADPTAASDEDLIEALTGDPLKIPKGVVRKNIKLLRGSRISMDESRGPGPSYDVLPSVPDDEGFLQMLKVGGELKVGKTEVISAVRAGLAVRLGLYDLPATLVEKMERFAEEQDEPCGTKFYELQKMIVQRDYAEVLSVLKVSGQFVSAARKKNFLRRLDDILWESLMKFHEQLKGWQEGWAAGVANPAVLLASLAMGQAGTGGMMPPGMMQPPETDGVRDAAEDVINQVNKVFAGMGIPISRALAYDASKIRMVLEDSDLPAALGATNKEQMLKLLGVGVAAGDVRLERNITRYTLAIMELPSITVGNEEYGYLSAMIMLGNQIPWGTLSS
jgi:hypothetical protein